MWDEGIEGEASIANAAAGLLLWSVFAVNGIERRGLRYLLQARHIAIDIGLYDRASVSRIYDPSYPRRTRARAVFAWGFFSCLS